MEKFSNLIDGSLHSTHFIYDYMASDRILERKPAAATLWTNLSY